MTSGLAVSDVLGLSVGVPQSSAAGWTFAAPAGTTISAAALDRDLYKRGDDTWLLFVSDQNGAQVAGQDCTIHPAVAAQCELSGTLNLSGLSDTALSVGVICSAGCVNGSFEHNVRADLDHALVTLSDPTPPGRPSASGPLSRPSWHSGTGTLAVSSADGVGISQVQVKAGGALLSSLSQSCDYTYPVPCPPASGVPLEIDTTKLADGVDPLTLVATDSAQNTSTSTISVMIANRPPGTPRLTGAPVGWTAQTSAAISAEVPPSGVPITTVAWMLCAASCGVTHTLPVPLAATSVGFTVVAPGAGAYTIEAYTLDAAGHASLTAAEPFYVARQAPAAAAGRGAGAAILPAGSTASVALPAAVGRRGVRLRLRVRRLARHRLELDVRTRPTRAGRLLVGLAFDGHRAQSRELALRRGATAVVVRIPSGARKLTVALEGLGANATREVLLGRASRRRR